MKQLLLICLFVFAFLALAAQNSGNDANSIRKQMATIRQTTNWEDPVAAKLANERIRELSKKLLLTSKSPQKQILSNEEIDEQAEDKMQLIDQILKSAREGENADVLLGEPIRKKIVEEYKEDESPNKINQEFFQNMNLLIIDMSAQRVQYTIDQMKNYTGIKTLIITGGKNGAVVNLPLLLNNAAKYPLEHLYIINFKSFVKTLPLQINNFKNLNTLGLFNNSLSELPASLVSMSGIDSLFLDCNPIATLEPTIGNFKELKKLGIAKTTVSDSEVKKIQQQLPNCQILKQ